MANLAYSPQRGPYAIPQMPSQKRQKRHIRLNRTTFNYMFLWLRNQELRRRHLDAADTTAAAPLLRQPQAPSSLRLHLRSRLQFKARTTQKPAALPRRTQLSGDFRLFSREHRTSIWQN